METSAQSRHMTTTVSFCSQLPLLAKLSTGSHWVTLCTHHWTARALTPYKSVDVPVFKTTLQLYCCVLPDEDYQRVVEMSHIKFLVHWRKSDKLQRYSITPGPWRSPNNCIAVCTVVLVCMYSHVVKIGLLPLQRDLKLRISFICVQALKFVVLILQL